MNSTAVSIDPLRNGSIYKIKDLNFLRSPQHQISHVIVKQKEVSSQSPVVSVETSKIRERFDRT
jgi:hypothetical protein